MATMTREVRAFMREHLASVEVELANYLANDEWEHDEYYRDHVNHLQEVRLWLRVQCDERLTPSSDVATFDDGIWEQYFVS